MPDGSSPTDYQNVAQEILEHKFGGQVQSQGTQTDDGVQVVMQSGHAQEITMTAMSNDGRQILSGSMDGTVKLWDVASGQEVRTFSGFSMGLMDQVSFGADGRLVIIGDGIKTYLFDGTSGRRVRDLGGGATMGFGGRTVVASGGRYAATSPAGDRLTGPDSGEIRIVELETGEVVWRTPVSDMQIPLALSDDGKVLLLQHMKMRAGFFGGADVKMDVQIWDMGARRPRGALPFLKDIDARGIRFVLSHDGRYVITEAPNMPLNLYALDADKPVATLAADGSRFNFLHPAQFSADGSTALQASQEGSIDLWQVPSGKHLQQIPGKSAAFGPDGRTLAISVEGGGAPVIYDLASGKKIPLAGGAVAVWELAPVLGGRSAVATMQDGSTRLWDLATGELQRNLDCPGGGAVSVGARADGAAVAVGCVDGSVWLWPLPAADTPRQLVPSTPGPATRSLVRFTADGRRSVVAREGYISVRDVASGQELRRIELPEARPSPMANYQQIDEAALKSLSKSQREAMERANASLNDPKMQATMRAAAKIVTDIAIHPDAQSLVVARQNDVTVWSLATGEMLRTLGAAESTQARNASLQDQARRLGLSGGNRSIAKQLEALMAQASGGATISDDAEDALSGLFQGAAHLAFRRDGVLMTTGAGGAKLWDVTNGQRIRSAIGLGGMRAVMRAQYDASAAADLFENITNGIFSPDGRIVALVADKDIHLEDAASGQELAVLHGHRSNIAAIAFTPDGKRLLSGGSDGTLRIWSIPKTTELAQLIALGHSDYVAVTPDQYYRASKSRIKGVAFRVKDQLYPFEQFDLRFNRPDIVLERLGVADADSIQSYRQAYQHRLKKLGFTEEMLGTDFHLPTVEIASQDIPVSTEAGALSIDVRAQDDKYALDRLQLFVNDVPVFGSNGIAIAGEQHDVRNKVDVPLVAGRNKIQVSALNRQGAESLRQTVYTNATGSFAPGDIYLVAIGVSQYANANYNLRYAAKDAGDLASAYSALGQGTITHGAVHILSLTNEKATREHIRAARDWLAQAKTGDLAIVFAAGHGMTDAATSYYFGTYDIDAEHPASHGLPYGDFEGLLDGIAPLRKMLLIDTCFSGEIDNDELVAVASSDAGARGQVSMRAFKVQRGVQIVAADSATGAASSALRFQQDWFADLRRGTGAVVISSASGNEYAFEGEQWNNGVFTYALLQGLKNGAADADHDQRITVGELQAYVIDQVRKLTAGGQNPTVRRENLDYDFEVF